MARATTTRPRARATDSARRREILEIAAGFLAERGIVATTVRDIGDRAGILSGSLYHHISSKGELIAEILVPVVRSQIEAFDAITEATTDSNEIVRRLIEAAVAQTAANPHAARILRNDSHHFAEFAGLGEVVALQETVLSRWMSAVEAGIAAGVFRVDADPAIVTWSIADVVLGAYRFIEPVGRMPADQVAEQLSAMIMAGLATR